MDNYSRRTCLYVTGFDKDIDRRTLLAEFEKFGRTDKLYLDKRGQFAKVYFVNKQSAEAAFRELNNCLLNWKVAFFNNSVHGVPSNMYYDDDYGDDEDFCENFDYCNIHGQPLVVLQADNGELYVNLKDIRRAGFAIFRKDTFDSVLADSRQVVKEFELHLLSEAKNYILKNRVASIDEDQILKTIERCKNKLLGDQTKNSFAAACSISQTAEDINIISNVQYPSKEDDFPIMQQATQSRLPKSLPKNFSATHVQRGCDNSGGGGRDSFKENGANTFNSNSSTKLDNDLNSSTSSETKSSFKKPRGGFDANKSQRSQREPREEVPRIVFEIGDTYDVVVSYKEEKGNVCWVQNKQHTDELEQVIIEINDEAIGQLPSITPTQGQLVAAEYEGMWNRGRVINMEPLIIHFLDYGNRSGADAVKALPATLKSTPALAARMVINSEQELREEMDLKIKIKRKYDDGTYVGDCVPNDKRRNRDFDPTSVKTMPMTSKPSHSDSLVEIEKLPESKNQSEFPEQKVYYNRPQPLAELHDGDTVIIVGVEEKHLFLKTKECIIRSKSITEYIKNLDKSNMMLQNVKVDQLVLSSMDGYANLFRAVVIEPEDDVVATVSYVDYPGEAELSVKSLRNVDHFLAKEKAAILKSPDYEILTRLTEQARGVVTHAIINKPKFTVVLSKDYFDLRKENGELLSKELEICIKRDTLSAVPDDTLVNPMMKMKVPQEQKQTQMSNSLKSVPVSKVLYEDMDWIELEPGQQTLMCYYFKDLDNITFLSSTDNVIDHLEVITSAYPTSEDPYKPEVGEMCLASYKGPDDDKATWYRASTIEVSRDNCMLNFVDFGNLEKVQSKDIRKFPEYLKKIPILGIGCECVGIPKTLQILERFKELMTEGSSVEVVNKGMDGFRYQIEIPELYKQLKSENLY